MKREPTDPVSLETNDAVEHLLLDDVIASIDRLPTLPAVVGYLLSHSDHEVNQAKLIELVGLDQTLTAKCLSFANSAFARNSAATKTVDQAIALMGLNAFRQMVCVSSLSSTMRPTIGTKFDLPAFWAHSIATACLASAAARALGSAPGPAFAAGLLHDIGRVVLACSFPGEYDAVVTHMEKTGCAVLEAEKTVIGVDHVQTGVALARAWRLGPDLSEAVQAHHDATLAFGMDTGHLATVAFLGNMMAHTVDLDADTAIETDCVPDDWLQVGLTGTDYLDAVRLGQKEYRRALQALAF